MISKQELIIPDYNFIKIVKKDGEWHCHDKTRDKFLGQFYFECCSEPIITVGFEISCYAFPISDKYMVEIVHFTNILKEHLNDLL